MPEGDPSRERFVVRHSNWLEPEDYYRFIHLDGFTADWKELGLNDDDLRLLQIQIMLSPQGAPVVPRTGGIRKMRFAPPAWRRGKRGAVRVLYAAFPDCSVAVLAAAWAKSDQEDISPGERRALKRLLDDIRKTLEGGS